MKKYLLVLFILGMNFISFSQSDTSFTWKVTDTTSKTKNEIYSFTKSFIANKWKSANNVIQNDDKEGGIIILKGTISQSVPVKMSGGIILYEYIYTYTISIRFKDNKYQFLVDDIYCNSTYCSCNYKPIPIQPNLKYPGYWKSGIKEDEWYSVTEKVKKNLHSITNSYTTEINNYKDDF